MELKTGVLGMCILLLGDDNDENGRKALQFCSPRSTLLPGLHTCLYSNNSISPGAISD
jgi:hypothetical protein